MPQTDQKSVGRYQFYFGSHKKVRFASEYGVHARHWPVTSTMSAEHPQHLEQVKSMNYPHRIRTCTLSDYE